MAMVSVTFAFAQKKEIAAAFKAVEAGDMATTSAQVSAAEAALAGKQAEPALMEKLYYAKGISLIKSGKVAEGAAVLAKINTLKSDKFSPTLAPKVGAAVNDVLQASNKAAMDAYNAKNYAAAAPKFLEVYNLLKAAGQDNKQYLYYSALNYDLAKDYPNAISTYEDLIKSGYTGVETTYTAKNKKSGKVENLDRTAFDLYKKMGAGSDYTDFKTETSKSMEEELYGNYSRLLFDAGKYDDVIRVTTEGLKKFPQNSNMLNQKGLSYFKTNRGSEFVSTLKETVAKNPNDANAYYNLGVVLKDNAATKDEAIEDIKKSIALDPANKSAYNVLGNIYLGDADAYAEQYNKAKAAKQTAQADAAIAKRRTSIATALPYFEKLYTLNTNDVEVVSLLKSLYQSTQNDAKFQEFKAKEAALKAQGK